MSARPSPSRPVVAIVGATGAVGVELIRCLEQRRFPLAELRLFASARSAGKTLPFCGAPLTVRELTEASFAGVDIALFSAGGSISKRFAPLAVRAGATVVDNSSAFRMDASVPLVVPEINPQAMRGHGGIIANPNCCAIIAITPLWPIHRLNRIATAADGDLPGRLRRRRGGDGGAARVHARLSGRTQLRAQGAAASLRLQPLQSQHACRSGHAATTRRRSRSFRRRARSSTTRRFAYQ